MVIGVAQIRLHLPEAHSLKEKRRVVRSIVQQVQARFHASIAEVDSLDVWQTADLGIAYVSNSSRHADEVIQNIVRFVEENIVDGFVAEVRTELVHSG